METVWQTVEARLAVQERIEQGGLRMLRNGFEVRRQYRDLEGNGTFARSKGIN